MKYFIPFLSTELRNHLEIGQDQVPRTKQAWLQNPCPMDAYLVQGKTEML